VIWVSFAADERNAHLARARRVFSAIRELHEAADGFAFRFEANSALPPLRPPVNDPLRQPANRHSVRWDLSGEWLESFMAKSRPCRDHRRRDSKRTCITYDSSVWGSRRDPAALEALLEQTQLDSLHAALDEGEASGLADDGVFARVRTRLQLPDRQ
jgi:hypothetical protein